MKNERLMALTFIVVGCIGAVVLGFVVWQASSPSRPTLDIAMHTTTTTTSTPALYEEPGEEDFSEGDTEPAKQNLAAVDTEDPYLPPNAYVPSRARMESASPALGLSAQDQVNTSVTGAGSPTRATTRVVAPPTGTASGATSVVPTSGATPPTTPEAPEPMTRTPEPPTPPSPPRDPVAPTQPSPAPTTTTEESEDVTTPTVLPPAPTETDTPTDTETVIPTATATDTVDPPVESPTPTEFQDEPTVPLNPETPVG